MRKLLTIDKHDYDESWGITTREAARAIIKKGDKMIFVRSNTDNFFKFPGGGREKGEAIEDTLIREVKEEVGLLVKRESIQPYGYTLEIRKSKRKENMIFHHYSYYFFVEVSDEEFNLELDEYERNLGYERAIYSLEDACRINGLYDNDKEEKEYIIREEAVMKLLMEENK